MLAALLDLYACALVGYIFLNWCACGLARMYERSDLLAALFALLVTGFAIGFARVLAALQKYILGSAAGSRARIP